MIVFQNIFFSKKFIACSGCFGSFTKIKKGLGIFFAMPFFLLKISKKKKKKKCVIKFLFRQLMPSNNTLRFIFVHPIKQWLTGWKKREDGNTKIWISGEQKELFHSFWGAIIWWKKIKYSVHKLQARVSWIFTN